jgi:hypothetical protein
LTGELPDNSQVDTLCLSLSYFVYITLSIPGYLVVDKFILGVWKQPNSFKCMFESYHFPNDGESIVVKPLSMSTRNIEVDQLALNPPLYLIVRKIDPEIGDAILYRPLRRTSQPI